MKTKKIKKTTAKINANYDRGIEILANMRYNMWCEGNHGPDIDLHNSYVFFATLYGKTTAEVLNDVENKMAELAKCKCDDCKKFAEYIKKNERK